MQIAATVLDVTRKRGNSQRQGTITGELGDGKLSCRVCAARRFVVSPAQPGGTWGDVSGSTAYLDAKARGDNSMPVKQRLAKGVRGGAPQDPRDMAKAGLLAAQSPAVKMTTHRNDA